ncbi:MAG TPA: carboxypeptidase regulatory-like domain-containing protein [Terracidiphilus sp.]|nr:carboxypeptidase regulatory-like domain-containing protein [Terracidiphilus sp.]
MMIKLRLLAPLAVLLCSLVFPSLVAAQTGALRGTVLDPSGAAVPGASVTLTLGSQSQHTKSGADGGYVFRSLAPGNYAVTVTAQGFAQLRVPSVSIAAGASRSLNLPLSIAVEQQQVTVEDQNQQIGVSSDQNASQTVLKGSDLDALSDDPDELQNELQALAGPAAGPNGGQIYIDGFEGGQIPPKSSILEIRVNQNPFSAEFDRIGYGRIEIITKPGSQKLNGMLSGFGGTSALNTRNPLLSRQVEQPSYYLDSQFGNITGPISKHAAYFFNAFHTNRQNQNIVDATNPDDPTSMLIEPYPNPSSYLSINPRVDFMIGQNNMITVRNSFFRSKQSGNGVGTLNLPEQAINAEDLENALQIGDTVIVNQHLVNETHFQWRRIRNEQAAALSTPTITVQGAFTKGGNSSGVWQDHEDNFELQNYSTAAAGRHTLRFGMRLRSYRDANYSTAGSNGTYIYSTIANYQNQTPSQYLVTNIHNPLARAMLFDGSLFFEDDWKVSPNLGVGLGLRFEGQNRIRDHADWAPRMSMAWSPFHKGNAPAKTVIRAGYGWFYNRFTVPNSFFSSAGAPYLIQAIHDNGINQTSVVQNFDNSSEGSNIPSIHTIDPHFRAALDMQGGIGVDRQIIKGITGNITYLYTQGVHQYLTDNITAPTFDPSTYTITGDTPSVYNYQFQSGGVYKQHQIIASASVRWKHFGLNGSYTLNNARSDTQGVNSQPSVAQNPGFDYGRAGFDIRHRMFLLGTYTAPHGIIFAPLLAAQSGTPYNFTIGRDLTGNNQFNARPTYAPYAADVCGGPDAESGTVMTKFGCLDTTPQGRNEKIAPYNLGTGPANFILHMRVSKVVGVGPRKNEKEDEGFQAGGGSVSGRGLSSGGAQIHLDAKAPRKYNLTFVAVALNVLNVVNWGTPNGVMTSPLFGQTQTLAGGQFGTPTPGNRTIFFQTQFSF